MSEVSREYKDRLFTFIFNQEEHKDWTLCLYNAMNGSRYENPDDIKITTIKDVIYLGMHNDVSFIIANQLNLYEQQSSYNPNMPLRLLQYTANLFDSYVKDNKLRKHGSKLLQLPAPKFAVFYNGVKDVPEKTILKLSDSFPEGVQADIEVTVLMLNINYGKSRDLLDACQPLMEYSWIVNEIRKRSKTAGIKEAVDSVINELPRSFVLRPF